MYFKENHDSVVQELNRCLIVINMVFMFEMCQLVTNSVKTEILQTVKPLI